VVVTWAFGLPIFTSIMALGMGGEGGSPARGALVFDNTALFSLLVFELIESGFLIWFLHVRGWTLEKVGLSISWRGTGRGWLLLLGTYLLAMGAQSLAEWIMPVQMRVASQMYPTADPRVSMELVFLVSTVNGIFEELFVAGYIITALKDARGMWIAINVSMVVRLLYHLYQGPIGVLTIVPMGLLYGYVYARTRQLWPLIFAHVLIDIIGLSALGRWLESV
jgi:membrane protease YdiL (CAAX protease family)